MEIKDNKCQINKQVVPLSNLINQSDPKDSAEEAEVIDGEKFSLPEPEQ